MRDSGAMGLRQRHEERFAEEVLRRALGIVVTQRDDQSIARMVDALFMLPDGRRGALEVTTIGDREALEREAIAANRDWHVDGTEWAWLIHVGAGVSIRDLERHLPALVLACEQHGASEPGLVPFEHRRQEAFAWLSASEVSKHGSPRTNRPGAVDVLPDGGGGAVYKDLEDLPQWLAGRLRRPDLARKIDKLRATGRDELHLFLRVHDTAMPFSLYDPLAFGPYIPAGGLHPPEGLTALWLAPAWRNPSLWWSAMQGWQRENCFD